MFDADGTGYTPTFTKRHGREYRYYISQNLLQNRNHPYGLMSRLPAHEIETLIETALRKDISKLSGENEDATFNYIMEQHHIIPSVDLVQTCVERVIVGLNTVSLSINASGFKGLVQQYLNLVIEEQTAIFEIHLPFIVRKARRGAIVIEPKGSQDIFKLPAAQLKKLVQGVIWRDEHFDGLTLKQIAHREDCSEAYVGTAIFSSFNILQSAQPLL
jgi:hypothetical protein